ncbi:von Willebrand factor A domain-containing protein 8-like [Drosophila gunungcola]|uniref:von Willebrand factor A domain-containing protein 8-like n=1 Tax=Drosophila gunungcola TaxID=103775 RepID=UPI0022E0B8D1|nr:von Willebrand factor A domain-containing protein 8-like [Drosophila gunungcola]
MLANLQGRSGHLLRHGLQNARIWRRSWASSSAGKDSKDSPSAEHDSLTIGDVSVRLSRPKDPQLVPQQYVKYADDGSLQLSQSALHHLRWMLQKTHCVRTCSCWPGVRCAASWPLQFLELTQREVEYVALSRDTESDLKQRREIPTRRPSTTTRARCERPSMAASSSSTAWSTRSGTSCPY